MILETSNGALKAMQEVFIIEIFNYIFWITSAETGMKLTFSRKFSNSERRWKGMAEESRCHKVVTVPCRERQSLPMLPQ